MRILIVDDEGCKHSKVAHLVRKSDILKGNVIIETALALSDARSMLKEKFFDFLILDLNISDELGDNLSTTAGSEFIDEILEVDGIKKPANIVILSSNEESKSQFKQELGKKGFELLNFVLGSICFTVRSTAHTVDNNAIRPIHLEPLDLKKLQTKCLKDYLRDIADAEQVCISCLHFL